MYDWSADLRRVLKRKRGFSCCWKDVRLKLRISWQDKKSFSGFSCCWKDVRLKLASKCLTTLTLLCFSCCWKDVRLKLDKLYFEQALINVSVVVERMYDWSRITRVELSFKYAVSVVVERMYDWSRKLCNSIDARGFCFSCCWKDVRLKPPKPTDWKQMIFDSWFLICFSKMVDLHKKCHYFRKFGVIWVIAWLFLIIVVTSSYILSTTKSP